jgi:Lipid A 3-O-deacylase (PagL)
VNLYVQGDHLQCNGNWLTALPTRRFTDFPAGSLRPICIAIVVCFCLAASQRALCQETADSFYGSAPGDSSSRVDAGARRVSGDALEMNTSPPPLAEVNSGAAQPRFPRPDEAVVGGDGQVRRVTEERPKSRPEQELIYEGLVSYGNYKIFASGYDEKLFTAGVEYDRHSWGSFLGAHVDYVAELLPFVLLDKPLSTDIWGNPVPKSQKNIREYVPGVGISPIGFRLQWRSGKAIKPYLEAKGGILGFTKKVPSAEASYESFSLQSGTGVQLKLSEKWGLRLGLFGDFHFSNGFVVPVDPGLDVMNANLGVSYHF